MIFIGASEMVGTRNYQAKPLEVDKCIVSGCYADVLVGGKMCDYHHRKMPGDSYAEGSIPWPSKAQLMAGR